MEGDLLGPHHPEPAGPLQVEPRRLGGIAQRGAMSGVLAPPSFELSCVITAYGVVSSYGFRGGPFGPAAAIPLTPIS
jgi:hypothetical protein